MKLEMGENCFADHQSNHHFYNSQHHQNENYMETSPQYYNIIKTQPVASSTNANTRQLRNDHQCAMTTEETRRLTGLVAKTRALFESSLQTSVINLNNETNHQNGSVINTTPKKAIVNSISVNSPFKNFTNESSNNNNSFFRVKQSFSANNVNNLRKMNVSNPSDHEEINDSPFKENTKNNFIKLNNIASNLLTNSVPVNGNYSMKPTKVDNINYSTNYLNESNNNISNDSAFSRPSFIKIKRFQSPAVSQSYQMFDSAAGKTNVTVNNEKENNISLVKKSQSSNRILFSSNENNQSLNSRFG